MGEGNVDMGQLRHEQARKRKLDLKRVNHTFHFPPSRRSCSMKSPVVAFHRRTAAISMSTRPEDLHHSWHRSTVYKTNNALFPARFRRRVLQWRTHQTILLSQKLRAHSSHISEPHNFVQNRERTSKVHWIRHQFPALSDYISNYNTCNYDHLYSRRLSLSHNVTLSHKILLQTAVGPQRYIRLGINFLHYNNTQVTIAPTIITTITTAEA